VSATNIITPIPTQSDQVVSKVLREMHALESSYFRMFYQDRRFRSKVRGKCGRRRWQQTPTVHSRCEGALALQTESRRLSHPTLQKSSLQLLTNNDSFERCKECNTSVISVSICKGERKVRQIVWHNLFRNKSCRCNVCMQP
jgi:hypothetical protein